MEGYGAVKTLIYEPPRRKISKISNTPNIPKCQTHTAGSSLHLAHIKIYIYIFSYTTYRKQNARQTESLVSSLLPWIKCDYVIFN